MKAPEWKKMKTWKTTHLVDLKTNRLATTPKTTLLKSAGTAKNLDTWLKNVLMSAKALTVFCVVRTRTTHKNALRSCALSAIKGDIRLLNVKNRT